MKITHVKLDDPVMAMCYRIAKDLYEVNGWNEKAVPVCAVVVNKKVLSYGIGGNGMHQLTGLCKRKGMKRGSSYNDCEWCKGYEHAEQYALRRLQNKPQRARMFMYGNYRACPDCEASMALFGITELVILEKAHILFDRHRKHTVIGKKKQFIC